MIATTLALVIADTVLIGGLLEPPLVGNEREQLGNALASAAEGEGIEQLVLMPHLPVPRLAWV